MRNNVYEPSPQAELESAELRGPHRGLWGGDSELLGTKGSHSLPTAWPVGGSLSALF